MKNILILGGDGYLGWPTAMFFSSKGYKVTVVDNYFRRNLCKEKNIESLFDNQNLIDRAKIWNKITNKEIKVCIGDLTNIDFMFSLFDQNIKYDWCINNNYDFSDAVIHFAEQPSAPYSMLNAENSNFTLVNNIVSTNNLINAIKLKNPENRPKI